MLVNGAYFYFFLAKNNNNDAGLMPTASVRLWRRICPPVAPHLSACGAAFVRLWRRICPPVAPHLSACGAASVRLMPAILANIAKECIPEDINTVQENGLQVFGDKCKICHLD